MKPKRFIGWIFITISIPAILLGLLYRFVVIGFEFGSWLMKEVEIILESED